MPFSENKFGKGCPFQIGVKYFMSISFIGIIQKSLSIGLFGKEGVLLCSYLSWIDVGEVS